MSEHEKNDGVRQYRIANKKGYVIVVAAFTFLFGGPLVDVVVTSTYPDSDRDALLGRIDRLEKTIRYLENSVVTSSLECRRIAYDQKAGQIDWEWVLFDEGQ